MKKSKCEEAFLKLHCLLVERSKRERNQLIMPKEFEFVVTKKEFTYVQCSSCQGTGKVKRKVLVNFFIDNCPRCKGTGREKLTRQTEVNLLQALKELNLIK